jgi:predicted metal-dependent hydrolase
LHATRDWPRFKRWKVKAKVMLFVTRNFIVDRAHGTLKLLEQDGITGPKAWAAFLWFAFVRPGMLRRILGAWSAFFLPGFHPWKHDDRALIQRAERELSYAG